MYPTPRLEPRKQIDTCKWDRAVASSSTPSLYGLSKTLDHLCEHWDGLILGDYEAVMPIPWRRKFGIRYAYTPAFIQKLDIYASGANRELSVAFDRAVKSAFAYADVDIGFQTPNDNLIERVNFIKDLSGDIAAIRGRYTQAAVRSLRKAAARHCLYSSVIAISDVIALYIAAYGKKTNYTAVDYARLSGLAGSVNGTDTILLRAVRHSETNEVMFGALFFVSSGRIYYLLGAPTIAGRAARAGYFLIDSVMREFAGRNLVFDFEGSDIPSVAAFYRSFGPAAEVYYHLHHNKLPWLIRLFKK